MNNRITESLEGKRILILGFGVEGISTYRYLMGKMNLPHITIADRDENVRDKVGFPIHNHCEFILGSHYLDHLDRFDIIIKSPGIPYQSLEGKTDFRRITSQTELFLKSFAAQTIGVTGTKGKSTTSSLIRHILSSHLSDVIFVGNIGKPPLDQIDRVTEKTVIVYELSSHQLENIHVSPHIAVILNIYEEHLDHYESYTRYQDAKLNITKFQSENDWLVVNRDNEVLWNRLRQLKFRRQFMTYSLQGRVGNGCFSNGAGKVFYYSCDSQMEFDFSQRQYLPGDHNLMNIMASVCVSQIMGIPEQKIVNSILSFKGLPHRMEFIGEYGGIRFYNDSISTIPQATILAVKSLSNVKTLLVGGKDRGIDYQPLVDFLPVSGVENVLFIGEAGKRIYESVKKLKGDNQRFFLINQFAKVKNIIESYTPRGGMCLLSPAASSYDMFKNFEERGEVFRKIAESIGSNP